MCTHKRIHVSYELNDWTGEIEKVETRISAFEDTGLHTYKCTQCGEVGYYSQAAKNYFEKGITSNIKGLGGND